MNEIFFDPHVSVALSMLGIALAILIMLLAWNTGSRK
jgi:hypothetical protein